MVLTYENLEESLENIRFHWNPEWRLDSPALQKHIYHLSEIAPTTSFQQILHDLHLQLVMFFHSYNGINQTCQGGSWDDCAHFHPDEHMSTPTSHSSSRWSRPNSSNSSVSKITACKRAFKKKHGLRYSEPTISIQKLFFLASESAEIKK